MIKVLHLDTETTGLNPQNNGIHQISGIIEIDGVEKQQFNFKVRPFPEDIIEEKALAVSGVSKEAILAYPEPSIVYQQLKEYFVSYVNPRNISDKFMLVGYNVRFDDDFMRAWFKKLGDPYCGSWVHWPALDAANLALVLLRDERGKMPDFRLVTAAAKLGIEVDESLAHDALYDVKLSREIYSRFLEVMA